MAEMLNGPARKKKIKELQDKLDDLDHQMIEKWHIGERTPVLLGQAELIKEELHYWLKWDKLLTPNLKVSPKPC